MSVPVSILIPIKNEAANLPRCLDSGSWADEIFVVDSQSTDGSREIAEARGARVVQFEFNGTWPKKKNWALDNLSFRHEWVLILDADEELPPEAREEIAAIVRDPGNPIAGYWINRRFMFMGKWLKHSYHPNWVLRLFKHRLGRCRKITDRPTASGDNEVHEEIVIQGLAGRLRSEILHYAFPTIETFVEKHNRYSNWEAAAALDGARFADPLRGSPAVFRRRLARLSRRFPFRPFLRFLYVYVWQRGFLDGREGYCFARLHAFYEFLSIAKTFELKKSLQESPSPEAGPRASSG